MVKLHGAVLPKLSSFPSNPKEGRLAFVDDVLFVFTDVDGSDSWYPITNRTHRHKEDIVAASSTWVVTHNLNSTSLLILCHDNNGNLLIPTDITYNTANQVTITLPQSITGFCVLYVNVAETLSALADDSDLLDGLNSSQFLRSDAHTVLNSDINFTIGSGEGSLRFSHASAGNRILITPYQDSAWATDKQLIFNADLGYWDFEGSPRADGNRILTTADGVIPDQTGNSGKVLGTDGTDLSWVAGGSSTYAASVHEVTLSAASDTITLPWSATQTDLAVYIGGVRQLQEAFSVSGTTLTMDEELPIGTKVCVIKVDDTYLDTVAFAEQAGYSLEDNLLINGNFSRADYGTYVDNPTASEEYNSLNRWRIRRANSAGNCRFGQSGINSPNSGNSLYMRRNSGDSNTNTFVIQQQIESHFIYPIMGQKLTVSFKLRAEQGWHTRWDTSDIKLAYGTSLNESIAIGSTATGEVALIDEVTVPKPTNYDEWTEYSFTTTGVIPDTAGTLYLKFRFGVSGTAPADESLRIGEIKVEPGEIATPWRSRPISLEQVLCGRYYQISDTSVNGQPMWTGDVTSGNDYYLHVPFVHEFRTTPTITLTFGSDSGFDETSLAAQTDLRGMRIKCTSNATTARGFFRCSYKADAEL